MSEPRIPEELRRGREAYERRSWGEAVERLSGVDDAGGLEPEDLWRLAIAGYLVGRDDVWVIGLERAHLGHREAGEAPAAARAAVWLGLHLAEQGEMGQATGWFARASRVLDGHGGECVERGYLLLPEGLRCLARGDNGEAARIAAEAAECAEAFGDRDLLALAVHLQGRALLRGTEVARGLALLDEAMVAVSTGELSPQVTGLIYCSVIAACRRVYALDRAREWTEALHEWCEAQPDMVAFRGQCRVFRSELMRLHGAWAEALDEAQRVEEGGGMVGAAWYERGEVHRLRGQLAAAEEAYRRASHAGREPQPGLALLRLAQGERGTAAAAIRRALAETEAPLLRARLLPAAVRILLAADEIEDAERASRELDDIAGAYGTGVLETMAAEARGAVALGRGDADAALAPLRRAWRSWHDMDAPLDAARARALLGRACLAAGDEDTGALELEAARAVLERLGAAGATATGLTGRDAGRDRHGLTARELEVLAEVATGKTNRAIAETLFISEKTVARHLSNIFRKLGLSSRAAATAYAYEHGLTEPPA